MSSNNPATTGSARWLEAFDPESGDPEQNKLAWLTWFGSPSPDKIPGKGRSLKEMVRPIRELRVWRFSLYYVVVFGAYVALASWLPKYYISVYSITLTKAALLTAVFIFPASLLRPFGGALSDRFGARKVMYSTFAAALISTGILMMPYGHIVIYGAGGLASSGTKEILHWHKSRKVCSAQTG